MRLLFLLLLAANLALFAWWQFYAPADTSSDPAPQRRQLNPEKIRLLEGKELKDLASTKPKPAAPAMTANCLEWGGFAVAEASKAEQALAPLALGARLSQRRSDDTAGWWVFIPPQGSRAGAQKKTAELKALGIEEFFILQDEGSKMRWAVSLGVFTSEAAAKSHHEALKAKGVRSAQTGEREAQVAKIWFQLRGGDLLQQARLREAAQGFPGTEVRDCQ